jgi:predicted GH43/DUF377 family glycosyl hydrolase
MGATQSRVGLVVGRVMALPESEVVSLAVDIEAGFGKRHLSLTQLLSENGQRVASHLESDAVPSLARSIVLGAAFTAEFAVEGAALCNPSTVIAPDQTGLDEGDLRVVVSLRGIGEGHLSSLGFATAIIGRDHTWSFEARQMPLVTGRTTSATWTIDQFRAVLEFNLLVDDLTHNVLAALPSEFSDAELNEALVAIHPDLSGRPSAPDTMNAIRLLAASAYESHFPAEVDVSQRVLLPAVADEKFGIEDARFVRFEKDDGTFEYRATYTAYNGTDVSPRLIVSTDLRVFRTYRMTGPAAVNKGVALFPRKVGGRFLSLCRSDGETSSLAESADGFTWDGAVPVHEPLTGWELLQVGNCGSPIEIEQGWLVLTHGVGPMRSYAIGAMLLDRDDPSKVLGRLESPLLSPQEDEREGYVPNVVYSCGGIVQDGILWLPYGIGDARIGVAWVSVDELVANMSPTAA